MIKEILKSSAGFATGIQLQDSELEQVRSLIKVQWLSCIQEAAPEFAEAFEEIGMERYHELAYVLDHSSLWSRNARTIPASAVKKMREMSIFSQLESEFGKFTISDECNLGWEAIYWRIIRPGKSSDVGPIHADRWFWELNHWITPDHTERVKVWLAIFCQPGLSGLMLIPGSHLQEWPYYGEQRHGINKPVIEINEEKLSPKLFHSQPGDAIVFHDKLLHGGAISAGNRTRVSLEFTMFVHS